MYTITDFLDLEDKDLEVIHTEISEGKKILTLETKPVPHICPLCQTRMYSKGLYIRTVDHPILQDGYRLVLKLKQRRWKCKNPVCSYTYNEAFKFVKKSHRTTNYTDMMIIEAFRDFSATAVSIGKRFHLSDTHVMNIFDRYVSMPRLPLTDIISIDEVHIGMNKNCKYGLVIQDFYTGEPIDFLESRRAEITEPYFSHLPLNERAKVRYLITDMYGPYIEYVGKYFPNAVSVVDAFHVIQWMNRGIENYIRARIKYFKERDRKRFFEKHPHINPEKAKIPVSNEVYLLSKYRWLVLKNQDNFTYHEEAHMDRHYRALMRTRDYEAFLFRCEPRLELLRNLKEKYISFNNANAGNPEAARVKLRSLIDCYKASGDSIFINFAQTLEHHFDSIINSFVVVQKEGDGGLYDARLSNGPIESINRVVKDMKRNGRGFRNFQHFRNRFLFSTRNNPLIDATHTKTYVNYQMDDYDYQEDWDEEE